MDELRPWENDWIEDRELGSGGQAITSLLSHRTDLSRTAVLKRITPRWRSNQQARDRLGVEAEVLDKLSGSGASVPQLYDRWEKHANSEPFLLLEYIQGIRFDRWLEKHSPVGIKDAVAVTLALARTLEICHKQGIGHRDLKPANIILRNASPETPCLLDFGISFDSKQTVILTEKGEIFRNEFITLPECQDLTGGHRDFRTDITALAGLFFACLTGRPPIVLRDAQELAPHRRHADLVRKAGGTPERYEQLTWLFDRAFAYRIDQRYQALDEFRTELSALGNDTGGLELDLAQQIGALDAALHLRSRPVQLAALQARYNSTRTSVVDAINRLGTMHGQRLSTRGVNGADFGDGFRPGQSGEILDQGYLLFVFGAQHHAGVAVTMFQGVAVGMEIQIFGTSYIADLPRYHVPKKKCTWTKVAVIDGRENGRDEEKINLLIKWVEQRIAAEIRALTQEVTNPSP